MSLSATPMDEVAGTAPPPAAAVSAEQVGIAVAVIEGVAGFLELESQWRPLAETIGIDNPFLTWEWTSTWARHFWDEKLLTLVVRRHGSVIGLLPFCRERFSLLPGVGFTSLRLYGPAAFDHMFELRQPLIAAGDLADSLPAIADLLVNRTDCSWVEWSSCGEGPDWERLRGASNAFVVRRGEVVQVPVMALEPTWEGQRARLRRNLKESIRHARNAHAREGLAVRFVRDDGPDLAASLATFFALHRNRARSRRGPKHLDYFSSPRLRDFLLEVAPPMAEAGRLNLTSIEVDGQRVATRLNLEIGDAVYLYFSGFNTAFWHYSPMTYLVTQTIRDAIERGRRSVNFSPGLDQAKVRWPVTQQQLERVVLMSPRLAPRVAYSLRAGLRNGLDLVRWLLVRSGVPPLHLALRREAAGW